MDDNLAYLYIAKNEVYGPAALDQHIQENIICVWTMLS